MKAGQYYVGDLCYVIEEEAWREVCAVTWDGHSVKNGEFTLKDGTQFAIQSTQWGDGFYRDQDGYQYPVDSGSIGCVLLTDIKKELEVNSEGEVVNGKDNAFAYGRVVDFKDDFKVGYDSGTIKVSDLEIKT